jgi:hypothetical protein
MRAPATQRLMSLSFGLLTFLAIFALMRLS